MCAIHTPLSKKCRSWTPNGKVVHVQGNMLVSTLQGSRQSSGTCTIAVLRLIPECAGRQDEETLGLFNPEWALKTSPNSTQIVCFDNR